MATYQSPQVQFGYPVRGNYHGGDFQVYGRIVPATAALNDIYQICLMPNGTMITDLAVDFGTGLDTGTALTWQLGDATTPGRFVTGATVGRSSVGGIQFPNVGGTYGWQYPLAQGGQFAGGNAGATIIQLKITAAATTFIAACPIVVMIQAYQDPQLGGYT
jgi:hypothetical protein